MHFCEYYIFKTDMKFYLNIFYQNYLNSCVFKHEMIFLNLGFCCEKFPYLTLSRVKPFGGVAKGNYLGFFISFQTNREFLEVRVILV